MNLLLKAHVLFSNFSAYNDNDARHYALLSSVSYAPNDQIEKWTFPNKNCSVPSFQLDSTFNDSSYSAYGFVGVDKAKKAIVAAFQGTADRVDWITDLTTWVRYGYEGSNFLDYHGNVIISRNVSLGNVHHGFCEYYRRLSTYGISDRVVALARKYKRYKIVLIGHSLGGAAATVGSADLALRYNVPADRLYLFTFGAPRPGDIGFATLVNRSVGTAYRIVHSRDIVPHLAPCCHNWIGSCIQAMYCPYHAASQVWYDNDMKIGQNYTNCSGLFENQECSDFADLSVSDHEYYFDMRIGPYCGYVERNEVIIENEAHQDHLAQRAVESSILLKNHEQLINLQ